MYTGTQQPCVRSVRAESPIRRIQRFLHLLLYGSNLLPVNPYMVFPAWLFFCVFCFFPAIGACETDYWSPWVTKLTTNSAIINWKGGDQESGIVEYATASYYNKYHKFQKKSASLVLDAYQHVPLVGLTPNTSYVYRVKPSGKSDAFSHRVFRTMPVSGPFTFIVISDTHAQEKRFKYVADAIAAHETDVLFILDGGDYAGWDDEVYWIDYFKYADGMLAKFPLFTTIGNHEYHNHGHPEGPPTAADQYHWSYDIPTNGALRYSFNCSDIRFVVLDSPDPSNAHGDDPQTSLALARSQASWLKAQLDNRMAGTFTIHHHPIWDYGRTGIDTNLGPWETLYHTYPISANFAGHTHCYQRYSVKGIPYFVLGNAGGKFAAMTGSTHAVWYRGGATRQLGYLKVKVDPERNKAIAQEIFVAFVEKDDSETATIYNPPIIADAVTFPLVPNRKALSVVKYGSGSGSVVSWPPDIDCGSNCEAYYKQKERIDLMPVPDGDSVFAYWTGACTGRGRCSVVTSTNVTVGAVFEKK